MININTGKSTDLTATNQMVAGVCPYDHNIEIVGVPDTMEVFWIQNGNTHYFKDLSEENYKLLETAYLSDKAAVEIISESKIPLFDQVKRYAYYMYGELDSHPDIVDGKLMPSENYRHSEDCISLQFDNKHITIGDEELNLRDIRIIDMIKKNYPNKWIAVELGISLSTLDFHLRRLYKKAGVNTKVGLINKANKEKI